MPTESKTKLRKGTAKKIVGEVLAIAVLALISLLPVPEGLTRNSLITLGVLAWAVVNWIFNCMDDFIVAILMCVPPPSTAFLVPPGGSSSALWDWGRR